MKRYIIVVRPRFNACFSYLGRTGGLVNWDKDAERFESVEAANAEIRARGWIVSTSQLPRETTAYVVEAAS